MPPGARLRKRALASHLRINRTAAPRSRCIRLLGAPPLRTPVQEPTPNFPNFPCPSLDRYTCSPQYCGEEVPINLA